MEGPMEEDVEEADIEMDVGEAPPLEFWRLNRRQHHRRLCWQWLAFGRVVQVARWPSRASA